MEGAALSSATACSLLVFLLALLCASSGSVYASKTLLSNEGLQKSRHLLQSGSPCYIFTSSTTSCQNVVENGYAYQYPACCLTDFNLPNSCIRQAIGTTAQCTASSGYPLAGCCYSATAGVGPPITPGSQTPSPPGSQTPSTTTTPSSQTSSPSPPGSQTPSTTTAPSSQTPSTSPSSGKCFSGTAIVDVLGQGKKPISQLVVGDRVLTMQPDGSTKHEAVFAFSHRSPATESEMVILSTDSGHTIEASPHHLILQSASGDLVSFERIKPGDLIWVLPINSSSSTPPAPAVVRSAYYTTSHGLYAPHTPSGNLLVNGVFASCYTADFSPKFAAALLKPAQLLMPLLSATVAQRINDLALSFVFPPTLVPV